MSVFIRCVLANSLRIFQSQQAFILNSQMLSNRQNPYSKQQPSHLLPSQNKKPSVIANQKNAGTLHALPSHSVHLLFLARASEYTESRSPRNVQTVDEQRARIVDHVILPGVLCVLFSRRSMSFSLAVPWGLQLPWKSEPAHQSPQCHGCRPHQRVERQNHRPYTGRRTLTRVWRAARELSRVAPENPEQQWQTFCSSVDCNGSIVGKWLSNYCKEQMTHTSLTR